LTRKWPKSLRESKKTLKKSSKKPERVEKIFIQLKTVGKKTSNGWVKKFEPLNEGENIKCLIRYRSYTTRDKKSSKDDLEKKLNKAAMKKQMILEEKK